MISGLVSIETGTQAKTAAPAVAAPATVRIGARVPNRPIAQPVTMQPATPPKLNNANAKLAVGTSNPLPVRSVGAQAYRTYTGNRQKKNATQSAVVVRRRAATKRARSEAPSTPASRLSTKTLEAARVSSRIRADFATFARPPPVPGDIAEIPATLSRGSPQRSSAIPH